MTFNPIKWFFRARLIFLIVLLFGIALMWIYSISPFLFLVLIVAVIGGAFYYPKYQKNKKLDRIAGAMDEYLNREHLESKRQSSTLATPEMINTGYEFISLIALTSSISLEQFKTKISKRAKEYEIAEPSESTVWQSVIDVLVDNKMAFRVDWKWDPEWMIKYDLTKVIKNFSFQVEQNEVINNQWHLKYIIMGHPFEAVVESGIPHGFIEAINPIIEEKTEHKLVDYSTDADSHGFILIPLRHLPEIRAEKFKKILG